MKAEWTKIEIKTEMIEAKKKTVNWIKLKGIDCTKENQLHKCYVNKNVVK